MNIEHQKTIEILKWFEEINKIPRGSGNEAQIGEWMINWAKSHNLEGKKDKKGNVIINVPASAGYEKSSPVVIQGHLDMVCEKSPDSPHDFLKDPIRFVYDGEWLKADKTTLGADNGIAMAMGMTAALDKNLEHPPLELLFTVEEETSLDGADALAPDCIVGRRLLNIDSEKEGVFTIGSAGGEKGQHTFKPTFEPIPGGFVPLSIEVGGLAGGHSADIQLEKANALKILARTLDAILKTIEARLAHIKGGSADNAIPRDSEAIIYIPSDDVKKAESIVANYLPILREEFKNTDPEMKIITKLLTDRADKKAINLKDTRQIITLFLALPHGIYAMSTEIEHFVETSNNFASTKLEGEELHFITSQRSPIDSRLDDVTKRISSVVSLAGGTTKVSGRYLGWKANKESALLKISSEVYEKVAGVKPIVETTHGGLECGVFSDKFPGIDMISFGPTIKDPHSPEERIFIPSIGRVWDFFALLLKELK